MMFDDEDTTLTAAQDLTTQAATFYASLPKPHTLSEWYKPKALALFGYGQLEDTSGLYSIHQITDETFPKFDSDLDALIAAVTAFKPVLTEWVNEKFADIDEADRQSGTEDIQFLITGLLGPACHWPGLLITSLGAQPFQFRSEANIPAFAQKFYALRALAIELANIFNSTGFLHESYFRWVSIVGHDSPLRESKYGRWGTDQRPKRAHPSAFLADDNGFVRQGLELMATNPVALCLGVQANTIGLLSGSLIQDVKYSITASPEEAAEARPAQFEKLSLAIDIADHFCELFRNAPHAMGTIHMLNTGLIAWVTGWLCCNAIKNKEMNHPYDEYAQRLAGHTYWTVQHLYNSSYRASATEGFSTRAVKFDIFNRQICLSKRSVEYATPTYEFLRDTLKYEAQNSHAYQLVEPKALKPKLPDLIAADMATLDTFGGGTAFTQELESVLVYLDEKKKVARGAKDGVVPEDLFQEWTKQPEVTSPMNFFAHQEKKSVDAKTLHGTVQFVTGSVCDYRVKVVSRDADAEIKMIKAGEPKQGEWKEVTSGAKYKIRIVTSGLYDFTIQWK